MLGINVWYQWLMLGVDAGLSLIVQHNFAVSPYLRLFTFSLGVITLAVWWIMRSGYRIILTRPRVAKLIFGLSGVWLVLGLSVNEITPYVATDAYFLLGALLLALIGRSLWMQRCQREHIGVRDYRLPNSLFIVIAMLIGTRKLTGISIGPEFGLLLLSGLGALVFAGEARRWHVVVTIVACALYAAGGNRSFLLAAGAAAALIVSLGLVRNRLLKTATVLAFGLVIAAGIAPAMQFAGSSQSGSDLAIRLQQTQAAVEVLKSGGSVDDLPTSIYQRIYEAEKVLEAWLVDPKHPLIPLFGHGFGALIDMSDSPDLSVTENAALGMTRVHNIHFFPFMVIHRFGLVGLALFAYFVVNLGKIVLSYFMIQKSDISDHEVGTYAYQFGILIFVISYFFYCFQAANNIFDSTLFVMAAGMLSLAPKTKRRRHSSFWRYQDAGPR